MQRARVAFLNLSVQLIDAIDLGQNIALAAFSVLAMCGHLQRQQVAGCRVCGLTVAMPVGVTELNQPAQHFGLNQCGLGWRCWCGLACHVAAHTNEFPGLVLNERAGLASRAGNRSGGELSHDTSPHIFRSFSFVLVRSR